MDANFLRPAIKLFARVLVGSSEIPAFHPFLLRAEQVVRMFLHPSGPPRSLTNLEAKLLMFHKIDYPFLIGAFISFLASVSLWFLVSRDYGLFVGLWVPSILSLWVGIRVVILGTGVKVRRGK